MAGETETARTGRSDPFERVRRRLPDPLSVGSVLAVLAAWQLLSLSFPPYRFPGLVSLAENVGTVLAGTGEFDPVLNYGVTLGRVLVGFVVSFALAAVWGFSMGLRPAAEDYLGAPLFTLLTVPSVVWAFLGVLWFGLTEHLVPVFVVGSLLGSDFVALAGSRGLMINLFLAAFNMLPFGPLDGKTVLGWSKAVFVAFFVPALLLTVGAFVLGLGF